MERLNEIQVKTFETTLTWTIQNFQGIDASGWNNDDYLLSKEFSFDGVDVSGRIKFHLKQEQAKQWVFHFLLNDSVYSDGNSQLSIELPLKTWVKQPYNGKEIVIVVEDSIFNQTGTLSFPFKMIYKLVNDNSYLTSNESSQSFDTGDGGYCDIDSNESIDTESVKSTPLKFNDFLMHSSLYQNQQQRSLITGNQEMEKETENMKSVISYLESEINVLKTRNSQHDQLLMENDVLKMENEKLQIMIFGLNSEMERNKIKNEQSESLAETLVKEKSGLEENIKMLESEIEGLKKSHISDKETIDNLTQLNLNSEICNRECKDEQHKLLGLELQTLQMESQSLNTMILGLESGIRQLRPHQQRGRQAHYHELEQRIENMNLIISDQTSEIENLQVTLIAEEMLVKSLQIELGRTIFSDGYNLAPYRF